MHSFLQSIGFQCLKKRKEVDDLIQEVIHEPDRKVISEGADGTVRAELSRDYGEFIGIAVRGEYVNDDTFVADYYYPYFHGSNISTYEQVDIEKHAEKESFAGVCDEIKLGVTLIFYLQNVMECMNQRRNARIRKINAPTILSGLAESGRIILPIKKEETSSQKNNNYSLERNNLIAAARDGDEEAIESLTLEDIDLYSMITRRIQHEDIMTIVRSTFMPYGIESDQYSILGEILDHHVIENHRSHEKMVVLTLDCNNMVFDVCVNQENLLGEPAIGRRFKGVIWMQGRIEFESMLQR